MEHNVLWLEHRTGCGATVKDQIANAAPRDPEWLPGKAGSDSYIEFSRHTSFCSFYFRHLWPWPLPLSSLFSTFLSCSQSWFFLLLRHISSAPQHSFRPSLLTSPACSPINPGAVTQFHIPTPYSLLVNFEEWIVSYQCRSHCDFCEIKKKKKTKK